LIVEPVTVEPVEDELVFAVPDEDVAPVFEFVFRGFGLGFGLDGGAFLLLIGLLFPLSALIPLTSSAAFFRVVRNDPRTSS
jgi:hypothetical protein